MKTIRIFGGVLALVLLVSATAWAAPVDHVYVSNEVIDKLNLDGSLEMNFLAPTLSTCRQLSVDGNNGNVWLGCENATPFGFPAGVALFTSGGGLITFTPITTTQGGSCIDPFGNSWFGTGGTNILKFNSSGAYVNSYNTGGSQPRAVACDRFGNVWTANISSQDISKLDNNGNLLNTYPAPNSSNKIVIDQYDNIWSAGGG